MKSKFLFTVLFIALIFISIFSCKNTPAAPGDPASTATITRTNTPVYSPTVTPTSTLTSTPTQVIDHHFESGVQGWYLEPAYLAASAISQSSASPYGALGTTGCVKAVCSFTGTGNTSSMGFRYDFASPVNLQSKPIQFYMYVPATLAALSSKYVVGIEAETQSSPGVWGGVNMLLSSEDWFWCYVGGANFSDPSFSAVTAIRIFVFKPAASTDWAGDIYLDEVTW